jgi:threonine dehydrogenase-like Zn-dependent dehydrogenase
MLMYEIPKTQRAVQLIGPDKLTLNTSKEIVPPGPHQILCKVEAVGLCFSDLKLLKQFSTHARKTSIKSGIDKNILTEISSYMPEDKPTVPGHEAVVRVWAVGKGVTQFKPGQRFLVQTDYRWLPTANSNGSFGYNFEGALQEYVLMDERVITSPEGDSMLIPASEKLSAAAIGLVEPWACVEDSYAAKDRAVIKSGGKMLIVADRKLTDSALTHLFGKYGRPNDITWLGESLPHDLGIEMVSAKTITELKDAYYDDVIYFGAHAATVESLFWKVAPRGLINIVLGGERFGNAVVTTVGRVHYGGVRIIGTIGSDPAESMTAIPPSGEIRKGDNINVVGAGGPMGVMHVIRNLCQGVEKVTVFAGDLDDARLAALSKIAQPLAKKNHVSYQPYNPGKDTLAVKFDYVALMAPVPALVAKAVKTAADGAIINIFAGIPAQITGEIDLDAYIEKKLYFIGTSGSVLEDMKLVLAKVENDSLDTNLSVAAISGLDGAVDGIRAVEKALIPGKILVYPQCKGLGLTTLNELSEKLPQVANCLENGVWTKKAEEKLLEIFSRKA